MRRTTTAPTWLSIGAADKRRSASEKGQRTVDAGRKELDVHACSRAVKTSYEISTARRQRRRISV
jgi:hypothetical protein